VLIKVQRGTQAHMLPKCLHLSLACTNFNFIFLNQIVRTTECLSDQFEKDTAGLELLTLTHGCNAKLQSE
jgi:hypothetical protein